MPLHIIDTAGLRDSNNEVEQIGIQKAWQEIHNADRILMVVDASTAQGNTPSEIWPEFIKQLNDDSHLTLIWNKSDLNPHRITDLSLSTPTVSLSAKTGDSIDKLKDHLKHCIGYTGTSEGGFMARRRHLDALHKALDFLIVGKHQLESVGAGELLAEDLRQTQNHLNEITGVFTPDALLGRIFSSFCIGK
jgi:tRNA modification GTPase